MVPQLCEASFNPISTAHTLLPDVLFSTLMYMTFMWVAFTSPPKMIAGDALELCYVTE